MMNHRTKKKLTKRFGYGHYRDYKNERKRLGLKKSDSFIHFVPVQQASFKRMVEMLRTVKPSPTLLYLPGADPLLGYPNISKEVGMSARNQQYVSNHLIRISPNEHPSNEQSTNGTIIDVQMIKSRSANQLERRHMII